MSPLASPCLVDTNVPIAANLKAAVSGECAIVCIRMIREMIESGHLVLDQLDLIFTEYRRNLSMSGQPGTGDAFMKWVHDNRFNEARCTRVNITPTDDACFDFAELAGKPLLEDFDPSDKKFLATTLAHGGNPPILVACDTDFWNARKDLVASGVDVEFLCPVDIERLARRDNDK